MENKIIRKATELFLKLGFKSITMDDIATEMGISKKTIYKYFADKEILIDASTQAVQNQIKVSMEAIFNENHNAVAENFVIREMFKGIMQSTHTSPLYQLRKHYPDIHQKVMCFQIEQCSDFIRRNVEKGVREGLYRSDLPMEHVVQFYYALIFAIHENTVLEKEVQELELSALEYHTRAIATPAGIAELEKHLSHT